ncbi:hypothetical protein J3459_013750 [Metarhizium acridum]|nr:hypothetical protein J3459_013750 [Metarhizium acridum]
MHEYDYDYESDEAIKKTLAKLMREVTAIPYYIIVFLHLEKYFVNAINGARGYYAQKYRRYVAISAKKPITGGENPTKS